MWPLPMIHWTSLYSTPSTQTSWDLPPATDIWWSSLETWNAFLFAYNPVHGGVSQHALGQTPPPRWHPLDRHPGQTPPWTDRPPWADTPLPSACWDTHPPAQCVLRYTPPPGHCSGRTHPTGMHSCSQIYCDLMMLPFLNIFPKKWTCIINGINYLLHCKHFLYFWWLL